MEQPQLRIREAWGPWLRQYEWHHFLTLTFAQPVQPELAGQEFQRWARRVEQRANNGISWFYVAERGVLGTLHLHGLTVGTAALEPQSLEAAWRAGRSQIMRYDPSRAAAHYVAKEMGDPATHYDLNFRPYQMRIQNRH